MHFLRNRIQEAMSLVELGNRERALDALKRLDNAIGEPRPVCGGEPVEYAVGGKILTLEPMNGGVVLLAMGSGEDVAYAAIPALDAFEVGETMRWMADDMPVAYGSGTSFAGQLRRASAMAGALQLVGKGGSR